MKVLKESESKHISLTFDKLGKQLPGQNTNTLVAQKKYGENHVKTAEILGFAVVIPESPRRLAITPIGKRYLAATDTQKKTMLTKQLLRTPIVQDVFSKDSEQGPFDITEYLMQYMSETTAVHRRPNVKTFFAKLVELEVQGAEELYKDVFTRPLDKNI